MADDRVVEVPAVADVDPHRLAGRDVVDEQIDRRIRRSGGRERLGVERRLPLRLVERHVVIADIALVESVVGELAAVGRPPHRRALTQFFAVDPAC